MIFSSPTQRIGAGRDRLLPASSSVRYVLDTKVLQIPRNLCAEAFRAFRNRSYTGASHHQGFALVCVPFLDPSLTDRTAYLQFRELSAAFGPKFTQETRATHPCRRKLNTWRKLEEPLGGFSMIARESA